MSLKRKFALLKEMANVKRDEWEERKRQQRPRVDANLPLGIEIGSYLTFAMLPFLAYANLSAIRAPGTVSVLAYESFIDMGDTVYHFYLSDESILQVVTDKNNTVLPDDIQLWQVAEEVDPSASNLYGDFNEWVGDYEDQPKAGSRIGWEAFAHHDTGHFYYRIWQVDDGAQIQPTHVIGRTYTDPFGEAGASNADHHLCLYGRYLGLSDDEEPHEDTLVEYLMLDATETADEIYVSIKIGVPLNADDITVA